jgi:hypothetical protein
MAPCDIVVELRVVILLTCYSKSSTHAMMLRVCSESVQLFPACITRSMPGLS